MPACDIIFRSEAHLLFLPAKSEVRTGRFYRCQVADLLRLLPNNVSLLVQHSRIHIINVRLRSIHTTPTNNTEMYFILFSSLTSCPTFINFPEAPETFEGNHLQQWSTLFRINHYFQAIFQFTMPFTEYAEFVSEPEDPRTCPGTNENRDQILVGQRQEEVR